MSTDFNRKGAQVAGFFYKNTPPYLDVLSQDAKGLWEEVEKSISASNQCAEAAALSIPGHGCIDRFRGSVMQVSRLAHHERTIEASAPQQTGTTVFLRGAEALTDFESLLFHGRAALDRSAFFVAKKVYGQECDKYPNLPAILRNFSHKDQRAAALLDICNAADPFFAGVLCDMASGRKSLRSHVIHKSTAFENAAALFTLHLIENYRRIAFDAILGEYPLFGTAHKLLHGLTFLVLNTLSLYTGSARTLELSKCEPTWRCQMVYFRQYESADQNAIGFTIWSATPSGCLLRTVRLDPEIANRAY